MKNTPHCRPVRITRGFTKFAEGSVLIEQGDTRVLCTASMEEKVPSFLRDSKRGWVTAEYAHDSTAEVDLNVVMTEDHRFVEIQGTAEREPFADHELNLLKKLAVTGIDQLIVAQKKAMGITKHWTPKPGTKNEEPRTVPPEPRTLNP